jgi:hypothetical protein
MLAGRPILPASNEADSSQLTANSPKQKWEIETVSLHNNGDTEAIHSKAGQAPPLQT